MSRSMLCIAALLPMALFVAPARSGADVVGQGRADTTGTGVIDIRIDRKADAVAVANKIRMDLQLSDGAQITVIQAEPGNLRVRFAQAPPGATVTANLPEETRRRLGALLLPGPVAAGGTAVASGAPLGALALGVGAVGGTLGGLGATGVIGTHVSPSAPAVLSPSQ